MSGPRVAIVTLGCKVNAYDGAALGDRLRAAGCLIVSEHDVVDVVVVNSCTVTDAADTECRRLARRARRRNPGARVVVTGCWAQTSPHEAIALDAVDAVVGVGMPEAVVQAVTASSLRDVPPVAVANLRRAATVATVGARHFADQTRAFLKVQEGCDLFCAFCIIPRARGRSRSLTIRAVLSELTALADAGVEEVVLTGVHLGGWGHDLHPPVDLAVLLDAIADRRFSPRIRLSSIDPPEISEALLGRIAALPTLCPHLHVPLQAADDVVLRRMRRRNDVAQARDTLTMIRDILPDAAIGTDLIAGFPGETAAAFEQTLAFLDESPITYAHVFPYSTRAGTTAAKLPDQVPASVTRHRAGRLRTIANAKRAAFYRAHDGREAEVLVERRRDPASGCLRGYTQNYVRVHLDGPEHLKGTRRRVVLCANGSRVTARVLP